MELREGRALASRSPGCMFILLWSQITVVAELLDLSLSFVRRLIRNGVLEAIMSGASVRR
jgi:hypothetical protein